jgi:glutaredoxin
MSKFFYLILVVVVVFVSYKLVISQISPPITDTRPTDLILFWGEGCPHCETVKKYIKDYKIEDRLKIDQKEVYYSRKNQNEMAEFAKKCPEIDQTNGVGVPFAWVVSQSKCLLGDQPIISWIEQK